MKTSRIALSTVSAVFFDAVILEKLGVDSPADREAAISQATRSNQHENIWSVRSNGVKPCVERLATAGLRLGVISNSRGDIANLLERLDMRTDFETVIDSGVVGVEKPSPEIFRLGPT